MQLPMPYEYPANPEYPENPEHTANLEYPVNPEHLVNPEYLVIPEARHPDHQKTLNLHALSCKPRCMTMKMQRHHLFRTNEESAAWHSVQNPATLMVLQYIHAY